MSTPTKSKIQHLNPATLKPYWRNPRKNDDAVAVVRQSIETYGFTSPIIVDAKNVIVAGHTRYKAAIQLNLTSVPVIVVDWDEAKCKSFRIVDNKTSEFSDWDDDALIKELREIGADDMQAYFQDFNLHEWLAESAGQGVTPVTPEQTKTAQAKQDERFAGQQQPDLVNVTCPHCLKEFGLSRTILEK